MPSSELVVPQTTRTPFLQRLRRGAASALLSATVVTSGLGAWAPRSVAAESLVPATHAQAIVHLPASWRVGERLHLEMVKSQDRLTETERVSGGTMRASAEVEVLQRTPDGYLMRWRWSPFTVEGEGGPEAQLMAHLTAIIGTTTVDLRTDTDGMPLRVENLPELMAANQRAVVALGEYLRSTGATQEQLAPVMGMVSALLTEEVVEASSMREPQLFMLAAGGAFRPQQRLAYQDELPNPFGGDPIPSQAWFRLAQVDTQASTATIEWGQAIDREAASDMLQGFLRLLMEHTGVTVPEGSAMPAFPLAIDDVATFVMSTQTGWPQFVQWERSVAVGGTRQVERASFQVTPR